MGERSEGKDAISLDLIRRVDAVSCTRGSARSERYPRVQVGVIWREDKCGVGNVALPTRDRCTIACDGELPIRRFRGWQCPTKAIVLFFAG